MLQLPQDKANHALYGAVAFNLAYPLTDALVALALVAALAIGKEASDWVQNYRARLDGLPAPHGVEFLDALATLAGGALCFLPLTHF
jgi:hypothetical protein